MKYMINFQVIVFFKGDKKSSLRSTYTILEEEIANNKMSGFRDTYSWFNTFFHNSPLDKFIDISCYTEEISRVELKVGRITNTLSGAYITY